jgi:membrane protein required for colicin V production
VNSLDMTITVITLFFGVMGLYWGLIRQVLSVVGLVAGVVFASRYGSAVADSLSSFVTNDMLASWLGFVLVFLGVSCLASLLASLLRRFVGLLFLGPLDHILGGVLGLLQGLLACTFFLLLGITFPMPLWTPLLNDSLYAATLVETFGFMLDLLPESFRLAADMFLQLH